MCGIAGFLDMFYQHNLSEFSSILSRMTKTLWHRGPDDWGTWIDEKTGIALGHCRLSIIDLSSEGHQPMISRCGRYVITYNGEIYNFLILRTALESLGHKFRGHSDTEVMLAAMSQWGIEEATKRFIGMFSFAVWDRRERFLCLGRDRLGEKPLYYGWVDKTFVFASELKALCAYPGFRKEVNRDAIALYLRHNYIPAPYSIYKGIFKLLPGTMAKVNITDINSSLKPIVYWSANKIIERGINNPFKGSVFEAIKELDLLLRDAVKLRMVSDVPLGVFLSGGIDSSTVVSLMQVQSSRPVKTFTIGFHEASYNEAEDAKKVARHLGTEHTEFYVTPEQTLEVIPKLSNLYDEPFSDSSQIPTFLLAQLARQQVTVCLSGDGGDELFAGYNRYLWVNNIWSNIRWLPQGLRKNLVSALLTVSPATWECLLQHCSGILPKKIQQRNPGDKLQKVAEILTAKTPEQLYLWLVSHWKNPTLVALHAQEPPTVLNDQQKWPAIPNFIQKMMYCDLVSYLPDDILVKIDRASMGVSLESRVVFLDHRVVEFAWRLPIAMKIQQGLAKWILRRVLYRYVPRSLIERPKMGFGVPIDSWLRGPLREWAAELLDENRLHREGFFNPTPIQEKWREHISGKRNWQYYLWDILMFQVWKERWM